MRRWGWGRRKRTRHAGTSQRPTIDLWHGLAGAVEKTVIARSTCWHAQPSAPTRPIDERTRARHAAVHELLDQGVGLLECSRRLGWALNTVKRYARAATAEQKRPPRYGRTLVDPYREHYAAGSPPNPTCQ
jgi:hypothetical protein